MVFYESVPEDFINFILVTIFSLLIGLEQRKRHSSENGEFIFGTDRTFSLIGVLGFVLYKFNALNYIPFLIGFLVVAAFLLIFYNYKLAQTKLSGLTSIFAALLTYTIAPIIYTEPKWMVMLIMVGILILLEIKEDLFKISQKISHTEFITLAKFIIIAGVILPLLPDRPVFDFISISPYKFWLAIVVVSSISYISYLLQKFVFPNAGLLLTGVLGGLYSSTATTVVLARKSKGKGSIPTIVAAIILATAMMYLRLIILAFIFNKKIALLLLIYFIPLAVFSFLIALYFWYQNSKNITTVKVPKNKNPLEFKTAFVFGLLFIGFSFLTDVVLKQYGEVGIKSFSILVGVTDIDPFILNLFQNTKQNLANNLIVQATVIATTSNGFLKMLYAIFLGNKKMRTKIIMGFGFIILFSIILLTFI